MANINQANGALRMARASLANGELVYAAHAAVSAQRIARQCRAAARKDVAWLAHNVIAAALGRAVDHRDRNIICGVMAESKSIGWTF